MQQVRVALGDRSYDIQVGGALIKTLGASCRELGLGAQCAVISDDQVAPLYAEAALASLRKAGFKPILHTIPAGEASKCLREVGRSYDVLATHRLERKSFIVALGGGVVGDLAGFVASSYLRGVAFVQVPTTLLAQVDSSVGGKVGVNLKAGKNLVGAFYQPRLVLCDLETFSTLPQREYRAGIAEVIKYGVIYDEALFSTLERKMDKVIKRDRKGLAEVVARCCEIKAEVVGQDETESGLRAILNFGHTIGHAIEAISGYGKFLHGEAISIGQVAAARLSERMLGFSSVETARVRELFVRAGLPVQLALKRASIERLMAATRLDKKVAGGEIRFVLARKIGVVEHGHKVPEALVREVVGSMGAQ